MKVQHKAKALKSAAKVSVFFQTSPCAHNAAVTISTPPPPALHYLATLIHLGYLYGIAIWDVSIWDAHLEYQCSSGISMPIWDVHLGYQTHQRCLSGISDPHGCSSAIHVGCGHPFGIWISTWNVRLECAPGMSIVEIHLRCLYNLRWMEISYSRWI